VHLAYIWIVSHLSAKNYRNWWKFNEVVTKTNLLSFFGTRCSDFEKAFDKVPHKRLISKLYSYRLYDNIIDWICDFLIARKYRVKVNCSYFDWDDVTSGIPQGSMLGPLLFVIDINDLIDTCSTYSEVYVFADDAKFFRHILSATDSSNLQYAVDALQKWSRKWLLNLNIKKCHVVCYGRRTEKLYTYSICDGSNHVVPL